MSRGYPGPPDLSGRALPLIELALPWYRVHRKDHDALYFGTLRGSRWAAPSGEFGVLYVAQSPLGALAETLMRFPGRGGLYVTYEDLDGRALSEVGFEAPLRLVDLSAEGLRIVGADGGLCTTMDYASSQKWSLAFRNHPDQPDGILYRSRHDPSLVCAAVFGSSVSPDPRRPRSADLGRLSMPPLLSTVAGFLDRYGMSLLTPN